MHTAYIVSPPKNLGPVIESMTAFGEFLIVGTRTGHLLMYKNITPKRENLWQQLVFWIIEADHATLYEPQ